MSDWQKHAFDSDPRDHPSPFTGWSPVGARSDARLRCTVRDMSSWRAPCFSGRRAAEACWLPNAHGSHDGLAERADRRAHRIAHAPMRSSGPSRHPRSPPQADGEEGVICLESPQSRTCVWDPAPLKNDVAEGSGADVPSAPGCNDMARRSATRIQRRARDRERTTAATHAESRRVECAPASSRPRVEVEPT